MIKSKRAKRSHFDASRENEGVTDLVINALIGALSREKNSIRFVITLLPNPIPQLKSCASEVYKYHEKIMMTNKINKLTEMKFMSVPRIFLWYT